MCRACRGWKIWVLHAPGGIVERQENPIRPDAFGHNNSFILGETATRYPRRQLRPGALAAHEKFRLVLLCSQPDTVHGFLLRRTQTSTPLIQGSFRSFSPGRDMTPAMADCRYRAPPPPQLHGNLMTILNACTVYPFFSLLSKTFSCAPAVPGKNPS